MYIAFKYAIHSSTGAVRLPVLLLSFRVSPWPISQYVTFQYTWDSLGGAGGVGCLLSLPEGKCLLKSEPCLPLIIHGLVFQRNTSWCCRCVF